MLEVRVVAGIILFGAGVFLAGFQLGCRQRTRSADSHRILPTPETERQGGAGPPEPEGRRGVVTPALSAVTPAEAKYWLQRFLEEHRARREHGEKGTRHPESPPIRYQP